MNRFETQKRIKLRYLFLIAGTLLLAWQWHEYAKSFDSCQNSLQELKDNLAQLDYSISELDLLINNSRPVEE